MEQQQGFDWSKLFTDLGSWKQPGVVDENMQYGLAGMAKALNPNGITGNAGQAFQQYVQGVAAQEAFKKRMQQNETFYQLMAKLLGGTPATGQAGPQASGIGFDQVERDQQFSSNNWLNYLPPTVRRE